MSALKKISELTALLGAAVASGDQLPIVDASAGATKSITFSELMAAVNIAGVTLKDSVFVLQDNGDATKQGMFELSGISAGQVRTLTWPNYDGTIATLAGTETFTNKTLTSPVISGGTINNAVIGGTTPAAATFSTLTIKDSDAGASAAPLIDLFRDSASPAANDQIGSIIASGRDSAGSKETYASMTAFISDPTNGSEDGGWLFTGTGNIGHTFQAANAGNGVVVVRDTASGNAYFRLQNTTSSNGFLGYEGTALVLYANNVKGFSLSSAGDVSLGSGPGSESLRAVRVASASRWLVASGSNGGSPSLDTSAGNMTLKAAGTEWALAEAATSKVFMGGSGTSTMLGYTWPQTSGLYVGPRTAGHMGLSLLGSTGGYGSGIDISSLPTSGTNPVSMGRIFAEGAAAWNSTASTQDARMSLQVAQDGSLVTRLFIDQDGTMTLGNVAGSEALRVIPTASGVNRVEAVSGTTGNQAILRSAGETNVPLGLNTAGNSPINLYCGSQIQAQVQYTASATRYLTFTGSNGGSPTIGTFAGDLTLDPSSTGAVIVAGMPTSAAGLATGALWNSSGTVHVA